MNMRISRKNLLYTMKVTNNILGKTWQNIYAVCAIRQLVRIESALDVMTRVLSLSMGTMRIECLKLTSAKGNSNSLEFSQQNCRQYVWSFLRTLNFLRDKEKSTKCKAC